MVFGRTVIGRFEPGSANLKLPVTWCLISAAEFGCPASVRLTANSDSALAANVASMREHMGARVRPEVVRSISPCSGRFNIAGVGATRQSTLLGTTDESQPSCNVSALTSVLVGEM